VTSSVDNIAANGCSACSSSDVYKRTDATERTSAVSREVDSVGGGHTSSQLIRQKSVGFTQVRRGRDWLFGIAAVRMDNNSAFGSG
jgi:hypothetical protein